MQFRVKKTSMIVSAVAILVLVSLLLLHFLPHVKTNSTQTVTQQSTTSETFKVRGQAGDPQVYTKLKNIAADQGAKTAWKYLIDNYAQTVGINPNAHDYAHYVGKLLFDQMGLLGMSVCTADFAFGCYHGLLDQAFRNNLDSLSQAVNACQSATKGDIGPYSSCIHGIGHGIASYYKDNDLKQALITCDKVGESGAQYCYDGVFMEFSLDALDSFYKSSDLLYPCNTLAEKYQYSCGRNQPTVLSQRFHKSIAEIARACQKAVDFNLRTSCFVAAGFQAVYQAQEDPMQIIALCESAKNKEFVYQCKSAAAGELIFQNFANWQTNAPLICNSISGSAQQKMCNEHLKEIQTNYNR